MNKEKKNEIIQLVIFIIIMLGFAALGVVFLQYKPQMKCENRIEFLKTYVSIPNHMVCREIRYTALNCSTKIFLSCQSVSDDYIKQLLLGVRQ